MSFTVQNADMLHGTRQRKTIARYVVRKSGKGWKERMNALKTQQKAERKKKKEAVLQNVSRAIQKELDRQTAEQARKLAKDVMAMVLWAVAESEGYGKKRLLRLGRAMQPLFDSLTKHYEMEEDDTVWLCRKMLENNYGIGDQELEGMLRIRAEIEVTE